VRGNRIEGVATVSTGVIVELGTVSGTMTHIFWVGKWYICCVLAYTWCGELHIRSYNCYGPNFAVPDLRDGVSLGGFGMKSLQLHFIGSKQFVACEVMGYSGCLQNVTINNNF